MEAVYLVPTRGRPSNAIRLAMAWADVTSPSTHLQFILDDDDPELEEYKEKLAHPQVDQFRFGFQIGERRRLGGTLNYWAPKYANHFDFIGFMGDDHIPRTPQWDQRLMQSIANHPVGIAYGNDLIHGPNIPTAVLMKSQVIKTLGYMVPPGLVHLYMDNTWKDWGIATDSLVYNGAVVIEHLHPIAGKAEWDDRYREVNAGSVYAADEATYNAYRQVRFNDDIGKLATVKGELGG